MSVERRADLMVLKVKYLNYKKYLLSNRGPSDVEQERIIKEPKGVLMTFDNIHKVMKDFDCEMLEYTVTDKNNRRLGIILCEHDTDNPKSVEFLAFSFTEHGRIIQIVTFWSEYKKYESKVRLFPNVSPSRLFEFALELGEKGIHLNEDYVRRNGNIILFNNGIKLNVDTLEWIE